MTVYIGDRTSSRYYRIYDKRGHVWFISKGAVEMAHCTRFELEIKGARERIRGPNGFYVSQPALAEIVARHYVDKGPDCIRGVMSDAVRFIKPGTASRVERCETAWWWDKVINGRERVNFGLQRGISDPEKSLEWMEHQVLSVMRAARENGGMADFLDKKLASVPVKPAMRQRWSDWRQVRELKDNGVQIGEGNQDVPRLGNTQGIDANRE